MGAIKDLALPWRRLRSTRREATEWDNSVGNFVGDVPPEAHGGCTLSAWSSGQAHLEQFDARRDEVHRRFDEQSRKFFFVRISFLLVTCAAFALAYLVCRIVSLGSQTSVLLVLLGCAAACYQITLLLQYRKLVEACIDLRERLMYLQAAHWFLAQAMIKGDACVLNDVLDAMDHAGSAERIKKLLLRYRILPGSRVNARPGDPAS